MREYCGTCVYYYRGDGASWCCLHKEHVDSCHTCRKYKHKWSKKDKSVFVRTMCGPEFVEGTTAKRVNGIIAFEQSSGDTAGRKLATGDVAGAIEELDDTIFGKEKEKADKE